MTHGYRGSAPGATVRSLRLVRLRVHKYGRAGSTTLAGGSAAAVTAQMTKPAEASSGALAGSSADSEAP